jgi:hypothetical protein
MGLHKNIETPEILWDLFLDFKEWLKNNPIQRNEFSSRMESIVSIPMERPLTWSRFDCYVNDLGIITDLEDYRLNTDSRYSDFKGVITRINKEMYSDKFEGASAGIYNANIIAKDLGLVDKQQTENTNYNHDIEMSPEERNQRIKELQQKLNDK